jgi:hypothetical protein
MPSVTREVRSGEPALKKGPSVDSVVGVAGASHFTLKTRSGPDTTVRAVADPAAALGEGIALGATSTVVVPVPLHAAMRTKTERTRRRPRRLIVLGIVRF